jgi:hypothetical protein
MAIMNTVVINGQQLTFAQEQVLAVALRTFYTQAKELPADMLLRHKYVELTEQMLRMMGEI